MKEGPVILGYEETRNLLSYTECIKLLREMFKLESNGTQKQPGRTIVQIDKDSVILCMPSYSEVLKKFCVKIVTEFKKNPETFGTPVQGGNLILMDGRNGTTLSIMNSTAITELRTASLCALAAEYLARKDSKRLLVIGSGREARAIVEAISHVFKLENVSVKSRKFENAINFSTDMSERLGVNVVPVKEIGEVSSDIDIFVTATNSELPVLGLKDVSKGAHIVSIGTLPTRRELEDDIIASSSVFVDTRKGVLSEAGDVLHAIQTGKFDPVNIKADIFELVQGKHRGRVNDQEITLFKSVGFGLLDVYTANRIFEAYVRKFVGT